MRVCGSAPDSQHGVDLPDEVAELVHNLLQLLILLLELLQETRQQKRFKKKKNECQSAIVT